MVQISDTKDLQIEFWTRFKEYSTKKNSFLFTSPNITSHISNPYCFHISMNISSEVYISNLIPIGEQKMRCRIVFNKTPSVFHELQEKKKEIENEMGEKLEWIPPNDPRWKTKDKASVEIIKYENFSDKIKWSEYFNWFLKKSETLYAVFNKYYGIINGQYEHVSKEVLMEYGEDHLKEITSEKTYKLLQLFRKELKKITSYEEHITKPWIGFKNKSEFLFAIIYPRKNLLLLKIKDTKRTDVASQYIEVEKHWNANNKFKLKIRIRNEEDLKKYLDLVKLSNNFVAFQGDKFDGTVVQRNTNLEEPHFNNNNKTKTLENESNLGIFDEAAVDLAEPPEKYETKITRIVRDTVIIKELKEVYKDTCQICGKQIKLKNSTYSEGHHLQPLGKHNGTDIKENVIILCPNHHAEFDYGAIAINPKTQLVEHVDKTNKFIGKKPLFKHRIDIRYLKYHFEEIFKAS